MRIWPIWGLTDWGLPLRREPGSSKQRGEGGPASTALAQRTLTRVTFDSGLQYRRCLVTGCATSLTAQPAEVNWTFGCSRSAAVRNPDYEGSGARTGSRVGRRRKGLAYRSEGVDGRLFAVPPWAGPACEMAISDFGIIQAGRRMESQILFLSIGFGVSSKVFVVRLQGGEASEVVPGIGARVQVMSAGWHPDGKRVSIWGWTLEPSPLPAFLDRSGCPRQRADTNGNSSRDSQNRKRRSQVRGSVRGLMEISNSHGRRQAKRFISSAVIGEAKNIWRMRVIYELCGLPPSSA